MIIFLIAQALTTSQPADLPLEKLSVRPRSFFCTNPDATKYDGSYFIGTYIDDGKIKVRINLTNNGVSKDIVKTGVVANITHNGQGEDFRWIYDVREEFDSKSEGVVVSMKFAPLEATVSLRSDNISINDYRCIEAPPIFGKDK